MIKKNDKSNLKPYVLRKIKFMHNVSGLELASTRNKAYSQLSTR